MTTRYIIQSRNERGQWVNPRFLRAMDKETAERLAADLDEQGNTVRVVEFQS